MTGELTLVPTFSTEATNGRLFGMYLSTSSLASASNSCMFRSFSWLLGPIFIISITRYVSSDSETFYWKYCISDT